MAAAGEKPQAITAARHTQRVVNPPFVDIAHPFFSRARDNEFVRLQNPVDSKRVATDRGTASGMSRKCEILGGKESRPQVYFVYSLTERMGLRLLFFAVSDVKH